MLHTNSVCQLNIWPFGLNHKRNFAHLRGSGAMEHVVYIDQRLPENLGFDVRITRVDHIKSIEATILNVGAEFNVSAEEERFFRGQKLFIQIE